MTAAAGHDSGIGELEKPTTVAAPMLGQSGRKAWE